MLSSVLFFTCAAHYWRKLMFHSCEQCNVLMLCKIVRKSLKVVTHFVMGLSIMCQENVFWSSFFSVLLVVKLCFLFQLPNSIVLERNCLLEKRRIVIHPVCSCCGKGYTKPTYSLTRCTQQNRPRHRAVVFVSNWKHPLYGDESSAYKRFILSGATATIIM